jgi:single-strand DNA-binding protein
MTNSVILFGNLVPDPDFHFDKDDELLVPFQMAFRTGRNKSGWVKVTALRKPSDINKPNLFQDPRAAVFDALGHFSTLKDNDGGQRSRDC